MTTYTLNVAKWRCGAEGPHRLGEGPNMMYNAEGYMCCIGQFAGVHEKDLLFKSTPASVAGGLGTVYDDAMALHSSGDSWLNTKLASALMSVNDQLYTTPAQKVVKIRALLEAAGHELIVEDELGLLGGAA